MILRSVQTTTLVFMSLVMAACLAGCMQPSETFSKLKLGTRAVWYSDEKKQIASVQAGILVKTNTIPDHPRDEAETLRAVTTYADAYANADVSACPEDFRKQFYTARQAWIESATDLQTESQYLQQDSPDYRGGEALTNAEASELERRTNAAMENALSQVQELRAVANKYGADWR